MRRYAGLAGVAVVLPNVCGPVPVAERVFAPGRFAYEAHYLPPGARDTVVRRGALLLERVDPDSLVGRWEVPGYLPPFPQADFTVVSYYLTADAVEGSDTLVVSHYLRHDARTGAVSCRLSAATRTAGYRSEGRCRLERAR